MTATKGKSTKTGGKVKLVLGKKTMKDLTTQGNAVQGGRARVNTDSCIVRVTCV
jgi:hypothetical protein